MNFNGLKKWVELDTKNLQTDRDTHNGGKKVMMFNFSFFKHIKN